MIRSVFLAAAVALLPAAAGAVRIVSQPEGAYELLLQEAVLPGSTAGYVIFTPCGGCDRVSLRVTASTKYHVADAAVPYAEFIAAAEAYGDGQDAALYVFYDTASGRVNRLVVDRLDD